MMKNTKEICFLIPLYGKQPVYIKLFLKSAAFNKVYKFIFITDLDLNFPLPDNVKKVRCSLFEFKDLIYKKTGIHPTFDSNYKIVDFKPAYGLIFQDFISGYDYWGMLDIDLILGDINKFITSEMLNNYDIISVRKYWLSGSFALFRNCERVNNLFKESNDWKEVFSSKKLYRFCETGTHKNSNMTLLNELRKGKSIFDIDAQIISFTHILNNANLLNGIRVYFGDLIRESINKRMILGYKDGSIFIENPGKTGLLKGKDYLHYHFVSEKSKITFFYPSWKTIPNEFYISEFGFFTKGEVKFLILFKLLHVIKSILIYVFRIFPTKLWKKILLNIK